MENILKFLAAETFGKSYRTSKIELNAEDSAAQIEYDAPEEILLKHCGETCPPRKFLSLKKLADKISRSNTQILNYYPGRLAAHLQNR